MKILGRLAPAFALVLTWSAPVLAGPGDYDASAGYTITPPYDPSSFTTIMRAFPADTKRIVYGYPLASRLLAASGRTVSLLQTFGTSDWLPVAVLDTTDPNMDPAFLSITPDGERIALGSGLGKPLYVFPTSILSAPTPVVLTTSPDARRFDLSYYSAAFRDARYLFVNAGGAELGQSYIFAVDTLSPTSELIPVIDDIAGASGGIAFDAAGDLVTGVGWDPNGTRTGELKIFDAASIDALLMGGGSLDYDTEGHVLATGMLSADSLGFDDDGNLFVGGGDVFGTSGHHGYVNIIDQSVVTRVLADGAPADAGNPAEVGTLAPDPCANDDWTGATYMPGVDLLLVSANLATLPPTCESVDWSTGATSPMTIYVPPDAPDSDGNGIPDGVDPGFEPQQHYGLEHLSRLVDALDSTPADASFDASVDFDGDEVIGDGDFAFLRAAWGQPVTN
ncbi:Hypothetical protein A7982_08017 [Minicystis rosea]|nr:Hypothetical protein A7982_08017 [Minicystis rosea]